MTMKKNFINISISIIMPILWAAQGLILLWRECDAYFHFRQDFLVSVVVFGGLNLLSAFMLSLNIKKVFLLALIYLTIYTLVYLVVAFMLIAVASPKLYFAWILTIIGFLNIIFLIIGYKKFRMIHE